MSTIFKKIIDGEIPCYRIAENESALAFLDINPMVEGHTLVIPKKEVKNIFDLPEEEMRDFLKLVKRVAKILRKKLNCDGVNIISSNGKAAQQEIMHLHFHIIPRYENDEFDVWKTFRDSTIKSTVEEIHEKLTKQ